MFVVATVIITSVVVVIVVTVVVLSVYVVGAVATIGGAAITAYLIPVVRVNAVSSMLGTKESSHGTKNPAQCVSSLVCAVTG